MTVNNATEASKPAQQTEQTKHKAPAQPWQETGLTKYHNSYVRRVGCCGVLLIDKDSTLLGKVCKIALFAIASVSFAMKDVIYWAWAKVFGRDIAPITTDTSKKKAEEQPSKSEGAAKPKTEPKPESQSKEPSGKTTSETTKAQAKPESEPKETSEETDAEPKANESVRPSIDPKELEHFQHHLAANTNALVHAIEGVRAAINTLTPEESLQERLNVEASQTNAFAELSEAFFKEQQSAMNQAKECCAIVHQQLEAFDGQIEVFLNAVDHHFYGLIEAVAPELIAQNEDDGSDGPSTPPQQLDSPPQTGAGRFDVIPPHLHIFSTASGDQSRLQPSLPRASSSSSGARSSASPAGSASAITSQMFEKMRSTARLFGLQIGSKAQIEEALRQVHTFDELNALTTSWQKLVTSLRHLSDENREKQLDVNLDVETLQEVPFNSKDFYIAYRRNAFAAPQYVEPVVTAALRKLCEKYSKEYTSFFSVTFLPQEINKRLQFMQNALYKYERIWKAEQQAQGSSLGSSSACSSQPPATPSSRQVPESLAAQSGAATPGSIKAQRMATYATLCQDMEQLGHQLGRKPEDVAAILNRTKDKSYQYDIDRLTPIKTWWQSLVEALLFVGRYNCPVQKESIAEMELNPDKIEKAKIELEGLVSSAATAVIDTIKQEITGLCATLKKDTTTVTAGAEILPLKDKVLFYQEKVASLRTELANSKLGSPIASQPLDRAQSSVRKPPLERKGEPAHSDHEGDLPVRPSTVKNLLGAPKTPGKPPATPASSTPTSHKGAIKQAYLTLCEEMSALGQRIGRRPADVESVLARPKGNSNSNQQEIDRLTPIKVWWQELERVLEFLSGQSCADPVAAIADVPLIPSEEAKAALAGAMRAYEVPLTSEAQVSAQYDALCGEMRQIAQQMGRDPRAVETILARTEGVSHSVDIKRLNPLKDWWQALLEALRFVAANNGNPDLATAIKRLPLVPTKTPPKNPQANPLEIASQELDTMLDELADPIHTPLNDEIDELCREFSINKWSLFQEAGGAGEAWPQRIQVTKNVLRGLLRDKIDAMCKARGLTPISIDVSQPATDEQLGALRHEVIRLEPIALKEAKPAS